MLCDDKGRYKYHGKDSAHIMRKYGTDGKMDFENFKIWWNSTYSTYVDSLADISHEEQSDHIHMETIPEISDLSKESNVAITRS